MEGWLAAQGYSKPQQDAVLGYVHHESDFNPNIIERNGVCLMQWAGERRRAILALGKGRCPPWQVQLEFADHELRTLFCGFWRTRDPYYHMKIHFGHGTIERCKP